MGYLVMYKLIRPWFTYLPGSQQTVVTHTLTSHIYPCHIINTATNHKSSKKGHTPTGATCIYKCLIHPVPIARLLACDSVCVCQSFVRMWLHSSHSAKTWTLTPHHPSFSAPEESVAFVLEWELTPEFKCSFVTKGWVLVDLESIQGSNIFIFMFFI